MHIQYEELTLRNAQTEDAGVLCRWWNDGSVMAHAGFPRGLGTNEATVVKQLSADSDETGRRLIIEADGVPIGEMNYRSLRDHTAEIGIKICEDEMQGKGYGTLCLQMLITRLFQRGYQKIVLDTNLHNVRAQHVYEKLGFEKLRVNKDQWRDQLGAWQSSVDYILTPPRFVPNEKQTHDDFISLA